MLRASTYLQFNLNLFIVKSFSLVNCVTQETEIIPFNFTLKVLFLIHKTDKKFNKRITQFNMLRPINIIIYF